MKFLTRIMAVAVLAVCPQVLMADFSQDFDDITNLPGWSQQNLSTSPGGAYFQGNPDVFSAHIGAANSYIGANFNSTSGGGTDIISNWLITESDTIVNGATFSFFTRVTTGSGFPDRLELRMSTNGASTNVGTLPTDVGDFTNLLVSVNPNLQGPAPLGYPDTWTQFTATITGLAGPTTGRFAFRYFVTNGGPIGANSNFIGIDTVSFTAIPEPTSILLVSGLLMGCCLQRRRR